MAKKGFRFLLLSLVILVSLTNCSKEADIVGLWEFDGEYNDSDIIDFTGDGDIIYQGGIGEYNVLDNDSIEIFYWGNEITWTDVNITNSTANFEWDGQQVTLTRMDGYRNLQKDILGNWVDEQGEFISLGFSKDGLLSVQDEYDGDVIYGNYSIVSDNTIDLEYDGGFYFLHVIDLSRNKLVVRPSDENFLMEYTREK